MVASILPALLDALAAAGRVAVADFETHVEVCDGYGVSEEPGATLMIGIDDPDADTAGTGATSQQNWANVGYGARDEDGDVTCAVSAWNGDAEPKWSRDEAFAIVTALQEQLQTDPTLGLSPVTRTQLGTSLELTQFQGDEGAGVIVTLSVHYWHRHTR